MFMHLRRLTIIVRRLGVGFMATMLLATVGLQVWQARTASAATASNGGSYTSIAPQRLADSRIGRGMPQAKLKANQPFALQITGQIGVPYGGVAAVMLNLTAVNGAGNGYLTAYPDGTAKPATSNLNFPISLASANSSLIAVGTNGKIDLVSNYDTDIIVDVQGWVTRASAVASAQMTTIAPTRMLDTRTALGGHQAALKANESISVALAGKGQIPSTASAVIANLTSISAGVGSAYVTAYPSGQGIPTASSITQSMPVVSNLVVVPIGSGGAISLFSSNSNVNAVLDVQGYITSGNATANNAGTSVITPTRVLDTRTNLGGHTSTPLASNEVDRLNLTGVAGIPAGADSAIIHLTTIAGNGGGYISVGPYGGLPNATSTANLIPKAFTSATSTVTIGPGGAIAIKNSSATSTHVIIDVLGWTMTPSLNVTPPQAGLLNLGLPTDPTSQQAQQVLTNANKYAMTTWWNGPAQTLMSTPLTPGYATSSTDPVRRLANEALGTATALSLGTYDPSQTGVSRQVALSRTIQLIDTVARQHTANQEFAWGGGWQGSFWAGYTARAAWLIWGSLPAKDQTLVASMIRFEANNTAAIPAHYWRNASGAYTGDPGDTGADDSSWWGIPLQTATQMLPNDPSASLWRQSYVQFALAAWAKPSDVGSETPISGRPLSDWINGSNVDNSGIVYNHDRVAPDYMTLTYQTFGDIWLSSLAGKAAPLADKYLVGSVYNAYTSVPFNGQTIYTPGSATIYYPQGIDWGTGQQLPYALVDAASIAYGFGNSTSASYRDLHLQAQLNMQARYSDGHTYSGNDEYIYAGREEHIAELASELYLAQYTSQHGLISYYNGAIN